MRLAYLALFICGLFARPLASQPTDIDRAVEALVAPYQALAMFDGVILLARGDTVVHHAGYGEAVAEWGVPMSPDARFRIASVSKPFTVLAIARLIEQGKLSLDTPLSDFAPEIADADRITVRHLVSHRAGIVHLNDLDGYDRVMRGAISLDSLVQWIARHPPDFAPGTDYAYSNGGYALLARVVERASGMSFEGYLEQYVFEPLRLSATTHETIGPLYARLARGYQPGPDPGRRMSATYVAPDVKIGGGSLVSSAPDLLRFARALDTNALVPRALADTLLGDGPVRYFSGRAPGYNAVVMRNREQDLTVIVLSNSYAVTANSLAPSLLSLLAGDLPALPRLVPRSSATDWTGTYRWPPNYDNDFSLYLKDAHWIYDEGMDGATTAAITLEDGTLLLPLYDVRCSLETPGADLVCTAPWSSQPLQLTRLP